MHGPSPRRAGAEGGGRGRQDRTAALRPRRPCCPQDKTCLAGSFRIGSRTTTTSPCRVPVLRTRGMPDSHALGHSGGHDGTHW